MDFLHDSVTWEYKSTIWEEKSRYNDFKEEITEYYNTVVSYFDVIKNIDSESVPGKSSLCSNYESDIVSFSLENKELKEETELYEDAIEKYKSECQDLKTDQTLLSGNLKNIYETFLQAKRTYMMELQTYFTIESIVDDSCIVYVQFFTVNKKHNDDYSIRLRRNTKTGSNELLDMTPRLPTYPQLCQKLLETNDMPGFLCCVRQSMKTIREKGSANRYRKTIA